jgi:ribosomal protein RSM22 (predicted rRNA methylase)
VIFKHCPRKANTADSLASKADGRSSDWCNFEQCIPVSQFNIIVMMAFPKKSIKNSCI